jgi:uncharacterized protein YdhG (YjbR/CyaY superfamily)
MAASKETTVAAYIEALPAERRAVIKTVRALVKKHLPKGYVETMSFGYPAYVIPLAKYPDTYNGQPLCYAAIAAQKNHYAVYLMCVYQDARLRKSLEADFKKAGKKFDMGKSCLRFRKLEDVPLDAIGAAIAAVPPAKYIAAYEKAKA